MKYKMMGTKVSEQTKERIQTLAKLKGISPYRLMQLMCDTIVRYMDDRHNLSPEMEEAMNIFEHLEGWEQAFNLCDYTARPKVREATYYLTDDTKGTNARAVHIEHNAEGVTQTYNTQTIFERAVCLLTPMRYRRMRLLALDMGCSSLLQLLDLMIDAHTDAEDIEELHRMFCDNDRNERGKRPAEAPYKRKHRKGL